MPSNPTPSDETTLKSVEPASPAEQRARRRLTLRDELALALLPTITILLMLAGIETLSRQRLLFASLASSAFLIYLDPEHGANRVRALVGSQILAALLGFVALRLCGPGYAAAALAMVGTTFLLVLLDIVHPPAISTALGFAFRNAGDSELVLFSVAVGMIAALIGLQRASLWLLIRARQREATSK